MESGRGTEERKYVQVAQSTINDYAESVGISGLPGSVAKELAGDVTYRLREIADVCSQFLRHSRKRTLTTEILNKVFKCKKISPVQGHGGCLGTQYPGNHGFEYVPEADLVVDADQEVDLLNEGLSPTEFTLEMDMKVSCNWLAIQGVGCPGGEEDVKVNPANYNLSPALHQFYSTLTSHIVGESQQLCLMAVQELRRNARLTPLLPYLVTFARWCLITKYKDNPVITARIIRLISALISNPHVNLTPKPYLSCLVSALLAFLIKERGEGALASLEHLQLAASVLCDALQRWATPTNQLSFQTLRALTENCQNDLTHSQLGALTALHTLGPKIIQNSMSPVYEKLLASLWKSFHKINSRPGPGAIVKINFGNQSLGILRLIGIDLIKHWMQTKREGDVNIVNLYNLLKSYFGDSIILCERYTCTSQELPTSPTPSSPRRKLPRAKVKLRLLKKLNVSSSGGTSFGMGGVDEGGSSQDKRFYRPTAPPTQQQSDAFNFLAHMGMPSDIFEPGGGGVVCGGSIGAATTTTVGQFSSTGGGGGGGTAAVAAVGKPLKIMLSKSVMNYFPESRPVKFSPISLKLNVPSCRQIKSKWQNKMLLAASSKEKTVPWKHLLAASKLKFIPKPKLTSSNYMDILNYL
eukprot:TRINITY_DN17158_c0_g1_i6.p1 TRINITY_DN17158_c0_g1~~TRINITY_DN17158_c0_g1_i6.p1  ORF type:complete len:638 (-),score=162.26 TRINITY_DN17158_c0_g1_i6:538-2451(-)